MDDILIGSIGKGRKHCLRVQLCEFRGNVQLDVRTYIVSTPKIGLSPTQKGITLPLAKIPELRELLDQAEATAQREGLLNTTKRDRAA